ncbi:hypothetical protein AAFF_G00221500 [Aldrovandia affinis]|uniref:Uncharacterized protein n=1 Tax=Aldrovandia affinis TaxID=143900 RepID=A0AAD7RFS8_9TELE|nr:hypothetical protein AAFF_G00221500 [Aldrovandia affinis]
MIMVWGLTVSLCARNIESPQQCAGFICYLTSILPGCLIEIKWSKTAGVSSKTTNSCS